MKNITLIISIIDTPNTPLSYTNSRSVFSKEERFEHTKNTISSVRNKIPDSPIFLIECSNLTNSERSYFTENTDYFLNIYDTNNESLIRRMHTISKSMGEGTMTIIALEYLFKNDIKFDNLFKISGRYWLNDNFNYECYNNYQSCIHKINNDLNNAFTCFYKLSNTVAKEWLEFLLNSECDFINCIGYEIIFARFLTNKDVAIVKNKVGIHGYVSVCGSFIDM
jgi:hypothetical protein